MLLRVKSAGVTRLNSKVRSRGLDEKLTKQKRQRELRQDLGDIDPCGPAILQVIFLPVQDFSCECIPVFGTVGRSEQQVSVLPNFGSDGREVSVIVIAIEQAANEAGDNHQHARGFKLSHESYNMLGLRARDL